MTDTPDEYVQASDRYVTGRSGWQVVAIVGPTAVGKTAVAEQVAQRLQGEIVSADSMQVYRRMDIGTAKPPASERTVPYHLLDVVDPGVPFSAALYQQCSRFAIDDILTRGHTPVVCGGTGLYIRAALDEFSFPSGEQTSPSRAQLESLAEEVGPEALHQLLRETDPASAALVHPRNVRRTIRALEMAQQGISYAEHAAGFSARREHYATLYFGLRMDREQLYRRIDARVDAMIEEGLLAEVASLLEAGFRDALTAQQAIGYKEFVPVIEEDAPLDVAIAEVKQASRRYAKRQLTWFRADPRVRWIDVDDLDATQIADLVVYYAGSSTAHEG